MTTPTTTIPSFKAALVTALQARSALSAVQVTYGHPGDLVRSESIVVGDTHSVQEPSAMKAAPTRRDETYTTSVMVSVVTPGATQQAVEARAVVLAAEVESAIAEDPTLGVSGVLWSNVTSYEMNGFFDADGRSTTITIGVETRARL